MQRIAFWRKAFLWASFVKLTTGQKRRHLSLYVCSRFSVANMKTYSNVIHRHNQDDCAWNLIHTKLPLSSVYV